jgi:ubiquinone/menaquinone biosynthesis C-methylase UbiE
LKEELKTSFDSVTYKKRNIGIWNEIAPRYHKRWAGTKKGPFQSTKELLKLTKLEKDSKILDLGCGTGAIVNDLSSQIGSNGLVVGVDSSITAIKIAKKQNSKKNVTFVNSDAETFHFKEKFDLVTCQYALFFFPNAQKALRNAKKFMKSKAILAVTVHGQKENVPFFGAILDAVTQFIPDYIPPETPDLDRFGTKKSLKDEVSKAGFTNIKVREYNFKYSPGNLNDYWSNYLKYLARPLKEKLNSLSTKQRKDLKDTVRKNTIPFTKKDKIVFPWQVLILTAKK